MVYNGFMKTLPGKHFRNTHTGEILAQSVEVCSGCHINFATTEAGDKHRVGAFGKDRRCITPEEANLIKLVNDHGAVIYKRRDDADPRWNFKIVYA
jgi:hypothetical protein